MAKQKLPVAMRCSECDAKASYCLTVGCDDDKNPRCTDCHERYVRQSAKAVTDVKPKNGYHLEIDNDTARAEAAREVGTVLSQILAYYREEREDE